MLKTKIMGLNINYEFLDINADITIVLLHGWGQNIQMMMPLMERFNKKFNILAIDFPGFGNSDEPKNSWSIYDYAKCIRDLIVYLKIKKVILLGHSFGGRVAIIYASKYKGEKLVCFASPYCREIKKLPLKTKFYKLVKKIKALSWLEKILKNKIGSEDYKNASPIMRGVLVKTINENLSEYAKKIKCPTLLIWGDLDTAVPIKRAYELEKMIKDSAVIVYQGATHYAYLEKINQISIVLNTFFKEEKKE